MNEFGKTVKKRLIDLGMTQTELCREIKSRYGYSADSGVMHRLFHDRLNSERLRGYIREILVSYESETDSGEGRREHAQNKA